MHWLLRKIRGTARKFIEMTLKCNKSEIRIFLSVFVVALTIFVGSYIIFRIFVAAMYSQIKDNDRLAFNNTVASFDYCFNRVNNIINTIDMLNSSSKKESEYNEQMRLYLIKDILSNIISVDDFIEEIVIFSENHNLVATSKGTSDFDDFFNNQYNNNLYAVGFWRNFAQTKHPTKIIPASDYRDNYKVEPNDTKRLLGIVASNQIINSQNIVIFINVDKLLQKVNFNSYILGSSLIVIDNNNNIIMDKGVSSSLEEINKIYDSLNSGKYVELNDYEYYSIKSPINNLTYISKVPKDYASMFSVIRLNQVVLFITLLFGLIMTLYVTNYLYKPIKKLLLLLGIDINAKIRDDFKQISTEIVEMKKKQKDLEMNLDKTLSEANNSILMKVIRGFTLLNLEQSVDFEQYVSNYKFYIMFSFDIHKTKNARQSADEKIVKFLEKSMEIRFKNYKIIQEDELHFIALAGDNNNMSRSDIDRKAKEIFGALKDLCGNHYDIIINLSEIYDDIHDISKAYGDIKECRMYRNMHITKGVVDIRSIRIDEEPYFFVPSDIKERFINYTVNGNVNKCIELANEILRKNVEFNIYYAKFVEVIRIVFFNMIDALTFCGCDKKIILNIEKIYFNNISAITTYSDAESFFTDCVQKELESFSIKNKIKLDKAFIIQYINMHYAEDLYLDKLAEMLETSPKYFSRFFKKEFNINFVDYMNNVRINHAKQYLRDTNISVADIGLKVGYHNPSTFTSTFKKICGLTPKEFRELKKVD